MSVFYEPSHFSRETKEVTFLLGAAEFTQRASLGVLQRIEARFGAAGRLIGRIGSQDFTVADTAELLGLILRDHPEAPKKAAMVAAIEPAGLRETNGALIAFLGYGIASDMPSPEELKAAAAAKADAEGNA